jgi:A/G-specific adenine glycosylase
MAHLWAAARRTSRRIYRSVPAALSALAFARALLAWYDREKRDLPWRREPNAYRTLVSELMLQQTVVATVVPYFTRFMARFPTLQALAVAHEEEVLTLWSGLGYYSRARYLHRTAQLVVRERAGTLPSSEEELRELPGVGAYTAAAVAAIAFSRRTLPLDGNVARVLARILGERRPIDCPAVRAELRLQGQRLVPAQRPGDFAQAMMELGALCCLPRDPRCPQCPVAHFCRARAERATGRIPARTRRPAKRRIHLACVAVERQGRLLLVRRPAGTLLAGTWVLPLQEMREGERATRAARRALADLGLRVEGTPKLVGELRHVFTHRDATASVFRARAQGRVAVTHARWVRGGELASIPLSTFGRKMIDCSRADRIV